MNLLNYEGQRGHDNLMVHTLKDRTDELLSALGSARSHRGDVLGAARVHSASAMGSHAVASTPAVEAPTPSVQWTNQRDTLPVRTTVDEGFEDLAKARWTGDRAKESAEVSRLLAQRADADARRQLETMPSTVPEGLISSLIHRNTPAQVYTEITEHAPSELEQYVQAIQQPEIQGEVQREIQTTPAEMAPPMYNVASSDANPSGNDAVLMAQAAVDAAFNEIMQFNAMGKNEEVRA